MLELIIAGVIGGIVGGMFATLVLGIVVMAGRDAPTPEEARLQELRG